MKRLIILLGFIVSASVCMAQIQSFDFYSFRLNNQFNVNPAYANSQEDLTVYVGGVSQNQGIGANTKTFNVGGYSKFSKSQGLGASLISDARGAFQTNRASLAYAYTAKFNPYASISFGMNAGVLTNTMNTSRIEGYDNLDMSDPTLERNYYNRTQFVSAIGLLFRWKRLEVSGSLPNLIATNDNINTFVHAYTQYRFSLGKKNNFDLTPAFAFQRINVIGEIYSGFLQGTYKETVWLKAGYQSNDIYHAMAGFNVENFSLGYGYRINNNDFANIASGSHELMLTIKVGKKKKDIKYNPTLLEIDRRLTRLLTKKVTEENKEELIQEVKEIKRLMQNTEINNSSPEASNEAREYLESIEEKLIELQNRITK
jgi:type IX secretion system PorP/SprF family membrane protein